MTIWNTSHIHEWNYLLFMYSFLFISNWLISIWRFWLDCSNFYNVSSGKRFVFSNYFQSVFSSLTDFSFWPILRFCPMMNTQIRCWKWMILKFYSLNLVLLWRAFTFYVLEIGIRNFFSWSIKWVSDLFCFLLVQSQLLLKFSFIVFLLNVLFLICLFLIIWSP